MGMPQQASHIVGGTVGYSPGLEFTVGGASNNIDIDADGVMINSTTTKIVIDLSECLGYRLGKQIPMTANFRVNYLRFGLRNEDDTNDNDGQNYFAGDWEWYSPTKHRIDAVQAWRGLERRMEEDDTDIGLMQGTDMDAYKGFRFGWDMASDINFSTPGAPSDHLPDGYALAPMVAYYNDALDNDGAPTKSGAIWDRKVGRSSHLGTHAVCSNGEGGTTTFIADIEDGVWIAPAGHCIEVLGGLLVLNITHTSADTPQSFDDDFRVYLDIGVSGWSSW